MNRSTNDVQNVDAAEVLRSATPALMLLWRVIRAAKCGNTEVLRCGQHDSGTTSEQVGWLVEMGYVEGNDDPAPKINGGYDGSCYASGPVPVNLTPKGMNVIEAIRSLLSDESTDHVRPNVQTRHCPVWSADRRELIFQDQIVKRFRKRAPNQECILTAFEEQEWPRRIDDPLPPVQDLVVVDRLHETIKSLNRSRRNEVVRFGGDGTGSGICWWGAVTSAEDQF